MKKLQSYYKMMSQKDDYTNRTKEFFAKFNSFKNRR